MEVVNYFFKSLINHLIVRFQLRFWRASVTNLKLRGIQRWPLHVGYYWRFSNSVPECLISGQFSHRKVLAHQKVKRAGQKEQRGHEPQKITEVPSIATGIKWTPILDAIRR